LIIGIPTFVRTITDSTFETSYPCLSTKNAKYHWFPKDIGLDMSLIRRRRIRQHIITTNSNQEDIISPHDLKALVGILKI
jgi:hypothetical protein